MCGKVANWWMPDDVVFVDEIPHTATGKIQKTVLRERFKDFVLPTAVAAQCKRRLAARTLFVAKVSRSLAPMGEGWPLIIALSSRKRAPDRLRCARPRGANLS